MKNFYLSSSCWILIILASLSNAQESPVAPEWIPEIPAVAQGWGGDEPPPTSTNNVESPVDFKPVNINSCFTPQETLKRCLINKMTADALDDCLSCDRVPESVSKQMVKKQMSLEEYNKQVCEMLADGGVCQQVCGACFHSKQEVAACEWDCDLPSILEGQEQPGRPFDAMPPSDEASTKPSASLSDLSFLSSLEDLAPQCQDDFDAAKKCVISYAEDIPAMLEICMQCHGVQDLAGLLASGGLSLMDLQKSMCEERLDCKSLCGGCYKEIHRLAMCSLGCDGSGFPPITLPGIGDVPFLGGGGSTEETPLEDHSPRGCEDSLPIIKECIANIMADQLNVLEDCMKCHNEVVDFIGQDELDPVMVKEKLCEERPNCESICGPCYSEIHKMATCSLGCGGNAVAVLPAFPFPGKQDTHENYETGNASEATEFVHVAETTEHQDNIDVIGEEENGQSNEVDEDMNETAEGISENEDELEHDDHKSEQEHEYSNEHESDDNYGHEYDNQQTYQNEIRLDKGSDEKQGHENESEYHNDNAEEFLPNVEGFNLQCQVEIEAAMECLTSYHENTTTRLNDCMKCHESQFVDEVMATEDVTLAGNQTLMCGERPDCESVCGECYPEIHKYASCFVGCGHDGRPERPPFPEKENQQGFVEHGFTGERPSKHHDQRRCESIMPAIGECIAANMTDQPDVLEECMKCHSATVDVLSENMPGTYAFNDIICVERPDCDNICGVCYPLVVEYVSCSTGCHGIPGQHENSEPDSDFLDPDHSFLPNFDSFEVQCQDVREAAMECIDSYQGNTTELLDECLKCHESQALTTDNATLENIEALMCADRPDCESVCGECYEVIHKYASCFVGCGHEGRPGLPPFLHKEDHHGFAEHGFVGGRPEEHNQLRCENIMSAIKECIVANMTDQPDVLEECMTCHNATIEVLSQNTSDMYGFNEMVCAERPECESVCGACYTAIHEFATCSLGCHGDNVTETSSYEHEASKSYHEKDEKTDKEEPRDNDEDKQKGHDKPALDKRRPFTAKYEQRVSVRLDGCTKLLNETQQAAYVNATEAFLKKKDSSVQVEFAGQRLVERGHKKKNGKVRRYRMLEKTSVEVDTRIGSSNNEKPGDTAIELIGNDDKGFMEALQAEDTSSAFEAVGTVQAEPAIETASPTSAPTPVVTGDDDDDDDDDDDHDDNAIILWIGIVLLVASVVAAIFFSAKLLNLFGGTTRKEYTKSSEQSLLTKKCDHVDISSNDDIFSRNFD